MRSATVAGAARHGVTLAADEAGGASTLDSTVALAPFAGAAGCPAVTVVETVAGATVFTVSTGGAG
jgi:hypothetical protein